jgi:carbamoyltransferase
MQWHAISGCPMLINTSLNIKNQPLINDLTDVSNFERLYGINVLV